jgi:hypothetical protein
VFPLPKDVPAANRQTFGQSVPYAAVSLSTSSPIHELCIEIKSIPNAHSLQADLNDSYRQQGMSNQFSIATG